MITMCSIVEINLIAGGEPCTCHCTRKRSTDVRVMGVSPGARDCEKVCENIRGYDWYMHSCVPLHADNDFKDFMDRLPGWGYSITDAHGLLTDGL